MLEFIQAGVSLLVLLDGTKHTAWENHMPIIQSLLDTDFYKLSMGQYIFEYYPDTEVTFGLTNRTRSVRLADVISEMELRRELDAVRELRFRAEEIDYLKEQRNSKGKQLFSKRYLSFLKKLRLPPYMLQVKDGDLDLQFPGYWKETLYWEIYGLPILTELYGNAIENRTTGFEPAAGASRFWEKVGLLRMHPEVTFSDFGTRRRRSRSWHNAEVGVLSVELQRKQFIGTSNVYLAMKYGLPPIGTAAHELFMVECALRRGLEQPYESQNKVLRQWWDMYGYDLSIALTDTLGTPYFLKHLPHDIVRDWKGFRQDSGDPIAFGELIIAFYESLDIDPKQKLIVFSDGLDVEAMIRIANHFLGRIRTTFGWGTNLTNDCGLPTLSLVIKAIAVWVPGVGFVETVKLSDNIAKAIGHTEQIAWHKKECEYEETYTEECRY